MGESIFSWIANNPDVDKTGKIILIFTFSLVPVFVVGMFIWGTFFADPWELTFLNETRQESFVGRVDTIYHEKQNHNALVAMVGEYKFGIWPEWENSISVGDSLSKRKGTTYIELFTVSGKRKILNYDDIVRNRVR